MPGPNENCQLTFLFFVCYDSFLQDFCFPPLNQNSIFQLDFDTPQSELLIMIVLAYILYENITVLLSFTIPLAIPCKHMT